MKLPTVVVRTLWMGLTVLPIIGCATNAPFETLSYSAVEGQRQPRLLIFLRGRGGSHEDYEKHGFIDDVRSRDLPYDMKAPNAHLGYYIGRSLVPRLKSDIIDPAKAAGYQEIWLVGASMGGLGALLYAKFHPADVDGLFIISPFLGDREVTDAIIAAGGLSVWEPGPFDPEKDWQIMLWDWLKTRSGTGWAGVPLYLGYGTEDSFVDAQHLLGANLPPERVFTTSGGHTPEVMHQVWIDFLDAGGLAH